MYLTNDDLIKFIENLINKYLPNLEKKEQVQIFSECYFVVMEALNKNPNINDYWAYVRTVVMNTIRPKVQSLISRDYSIRKWGVECND